MISRRWFPIILVVVVMAGAVPRAIGAVSRGSNAPRQDLPAPWLAEAEAGGDDDTAAGIGATTGIPASALLTEPELPYIRNELLVRFRPGVSDDVKRQLHERLGAQVIADVPEHGLQLLRLYDDAVAMVSAYQDREEVIYAEPNYLAEAQGAPSPGRTAAALAAAAGDNPTGLLLTPNDTLYPQQWHHAKIDSPGAWDHEKGDGVIIGIIDTGVSCTHQDLMGKCTSGYDFVHNDSLPNDDHGHGTHVSGIAAAVTNNARGVAGVGWDAKIMPIKALTREGSGGHFAIASGIDYAVSHGADVINLSLGSFFTSSTLSAAVSRAINAGVVVVAAAGNYAVSNPMYPASYPGVIGVSATTQSDGRASFSNYGSYVDVAAPGVGILSTVMTGGYAAWDGTSMASPIVAGLAALLVDQDGSRTPAQIQTIMERTALDLGAPGKDSLFGAGRIDAGAALADSPAGAPTPNGPPTATATYGPPTPTVTPSSDFVQQVEDLLNAERRSFGQPPLRSNQQLRSAAARHATDMARGSFCGHGGSDGSTAYTRMRDAGYLRPYGEIVACGQLSPAAVVAAWMASSGHRAIILCTTCTEFGAGHAASTAGYWNYWTVNFGSAPVSGPTPTPMAQPSATATATQGPPAASATATPPPPAVPPGGHEVVIEPANNRIGWVVSIRPDENFFDDDDTFTGTYLNNRIYHGAMQFDLDAIPAAAYIDYARLEMIGRSAQFLGTSGTWAVRLLDAAIDDGFAGHGYAAIHNAVAEATLLPLMGVRDLDENHLNVFTFSSSQVSALARRVAGTRRISFRMDGPTGGSSMNLFTWDTGYGPDSRYPGPKLVVHWSDSPPVPDPSATTTTVPAPSEPPPTPTDGPPSTATATDVPPTPSVTAPPPPQRTSTPTAIPTIRPNPPALELVPAKEDVGWVKQGESKNHFGDDDMYTGYFQGFIYNGAMQFDLSVVPPDSKILDARVTVSGRDGRWLSRFGNGRWKLVVLEPDIDPGWRGHGYEAIHRAASQSVLRPEMLQGDLDVGRANTFLFDDDQLWHLERRIITTKKLSLRLDGPRAGVSNVFSWATGYGGGEPPRLSLVIGPPGSGDNPEPTQDPADTERLRKLIRRINRDREKAGVGPVAVAEELTQAARDHTIDMAMNDFFSHTGSDGSSPAERVARTGFRAAAVGELLAAANSDADQVVDAWLSRERDTLLDPAFTHVGAHYVFRTRTAYRHYWTVDLAQAAP